jgi:hypothetical protein
MVRELPREPAPAAQARDPEGPEPRPGPRPEPERAAVARAAPAVPVRQVVQVGPEVQARAVRAAPAA